MAKQPFFMRFVEKQEETEVKTDVKAGAESGTADKKEWWKDKQPETMKYPSDGDDDIYIDW